MKVIHDYKNYILILDSAERDFVNLPQGKIEAQLIESNGKESKLKKIVSLEIKENNECDGISFDYSPKKRWNAIKNIDVGINQEAYKKLEEMGEIETRYDGKNSLIIFFKWKSKI